jgi:hypothetical protein
MRIKLVLFLLLISSASSYSQCAMCRAVLESGADTSVAEGINNGIVYLMALPYVLVAGVFYAVYRKMRSDRVKE